MGGREGARKSCCVCERVYTSEDNKNAYYHLTEDIQIRPVPYPSFKSLWFLCDLRGDRHRTCEKEAKDVFIFSPIFETVEEAVQVSHRVLDSG